MAEDREFDLISDTFLRVVPTNPFVQFPKKDIEQSIGSRFEQIAARDPSRVAIKIRDQTVTYATLNKMANRVAHAIRAVSGRSNEPAAVFGANDAETIADIMGVLKAGKIYVPLENSFSDAWAKFILADTNAKIVVIGDHRPDAIHPALSPGHILLDSKTFHAHWSEENLEDVVSPATLSQILYTSGTTGEPKGVMDNHRNILHNTMRLTNALHISPEDRISLVRPPTTGGGLCNLLLALLTGSTIFPVDLKKVGLQGLGSWLKRERITILHAGAAVIRNFAQQLTGHQTFPDLRLIRVGSGQIFGRDVELLQRYFPNALLLHILSCTEINTYRVNFLDKYSKIPDGAVPVGYSVDDTDVLILDDFGNALGANQAGEIAVRSAYISPGYWNNSTLTQEVFSSRDAEGRQIFRTGDLGRIQPNGCLEYLGRKDFRLKIRGYSIQAEEVEQALLRLPEITQAVVLARKDARGDERLVAYVTRAKDEFPTITQLRRSVKKWLPDYMVPNKFVILESLPMTNAGKIDRQGLPAPNLDRPELENEFSAPKTMVESVLAKIWSQALGINCIGIHDSFFDLGGDSIVASRIVSAIARVFPWELTMQEFYDACTIAGTARGLIEKAPNPEAAQKVAGVYLQVEAMSSGDIERRLAEEREKRQRTDGKTGFKEN